MSDSPQVIDAMGLRCPLPVQRLRVAIRDGGWEEVHLIGDDPESLHDIPALLERLGLEPPEVVELEGGWLFVISAG